MGQNNLKLCSKKLAYILRHSKTIDRQLGGWIDISDVVNHTGYPADVIQEIVNVDSKGRFEIDETNNLIRALYGHSVQVNLEYPEMQPPTILLHGTASNAVGLIMSNGLCPRSRQFVHLTDDFDIAINTGKRHGNSIVLNIEADKMCKDDCKFYNPAPHVWLVSSVPPQYIKLMNEKFQEINEKFLTKKTLCIVDLNPNGTIIANAGKIADYSDYCHISQYKAKDWYKLIMVLVNENDDWNYCKSQVEKIKEESPNFILFYTYRVQSILDSDIPYLKTLLQPNEILRLMDLILYRGKPLPIDYYDFTALLLRNEKTGTLSSFNVYDTNKNNQFIHYIKRLGENDGKHLLIHFSIPTRDKDINKLVTCIKDSIASIPYNIDFVWGCSFAKERNLKVSIFEK